MFSKLQSALKLVFVFDKKCVQRKHYEIIKICTILSFFQCFTHSVIQIIKLRMLQIIVQKN